VVWLYVEVVRIIYLSGIGVRRNCPEKLLRTIGVRFGRLHRDTLSDVILGVISR